MSTPSPTSRGDHIPPEILSSEVPIGRELGILFGFLIASLVIMSVYAVVWRAIERREEERDRLRREKLVARGVHHGRGGIHEKMLDQEVFMGRAELPVHGSRSQSRTRREEGDEDEARAGMGERMMNGGSGGRTRATSNSIPMAM